MPRREARAQSCTTEGRAAYAIADGIKRAFTRFGKWVRTAAKAIAEKPETETAQLLPGFAELFDTDDG